MNTSRVLTSELSFKTENRLFKYMLVKFGRMKTQMIMFLVFSVLSYPLAAIGVLTYFGTHEQNFMIMSMVIGGISIGGIGILTVAIATSNYDYFNRKTVVDMNYALPIKNNERFWGDFLAGIAPVAIVHLLSIGAGLLFLSAGRGLFYEFRENSYITLEAVKEEYSFVISVCFEFALIGFLALIGMYALTVLASVLSGRGFENWMVLIMMLIFLPSVTALTMSMPFVDVRQVNITNQVLDAVSAISPFMFIIHSFVNLSEMSEEKFEILRNANILPYLIFVAVIVALSYFLGTRRNVERVGNAFAHKATSDVLLFMLIYSIGALFCMAIDQNSGNNTSIAIAMVIITAIAFMVFEILTKRSFRRIHIGLAKYAGIMVGTVVTSSLLMSSNGFGIGTYIPELDKIASVTANVYSMNGSYDYIGGRLGGYYRAFDFADPATIEIVRELNKFSNENFDENYYSTMTVKYNMKNGSVVERTLAIGRDRSLPEKLAMSTESKQALLADIQNAVFGNANDPSQRHTAKNIYVRDIFGDDIVSLAKADLKALYSAYSKDVMAQSIEQVFGNPVQPLCVFETVVSVDNLEFNHGYEDRVPVYIMPHYENFLAELAKYTDRIPEPDYKNKEATLMYMGDYSVFEEMDIAGMNPNVSGDYEKPQAYSGFILEDIESNPKYMELLNSSLPSYSVKTSNGEFVLYVNGAELFVPDSKYDLAFEIFTELYLNS